LLSRGGGTLFLQGQLGGEGGKRNDQDTQLPPKRTLVQPIKKKTHIFVHTGREKGNHVINKPLSIEGRIKLEIA